MNDVFELNYSQRLETFQSYWDNNQTTARQLAAIGHISDRPPLEAREEGSRCITCSAFVKKEHSINALEGSTGSSGSYEDGFGSFSFHEPGCLRLQVRIPLDPQAVLPGLHGNRVEDLRRRWERKLNPRAVLEPMQRVSQRSSLFNLPTEIRLEIYSMILPSLDETTEIVPLNRDSPRVVTSTGYRKTGPRDTSKPNILRTCRAVHEEAMDILYSHTTFVFGSTKVLYLFLRSVGNVARQLIGSIDIHCGGREDALAFALLASCGSLHTMCIRLPRLKLLFARSNPIWMIDGVSCLLALDGLEKVTLSGWARSYKFMTENEADAEVICRELTRPKGSPRTTDYVQRYLES